MGRDITPASTKEYNYTDPYVENSFGVVLTYGGNKIGTFTTVSGGSMEITVIEYTLNIKGGGSQGIYIPGATGFEPVTLSYGVTDDVRFWQWWTDLASGKTDKRVNLSLVAFGAMDEGNKRLAEWHLEFAWPYKISGFNFDLDSTSAFIAEVTLMVENIVRAETPNQEVSASKGYGLG